MHADAVACNARATTPRVSQENDTSLYQPALESLRTLIRTATASMTSVPKPLKFLRPHYPEMQELYERWPADVAAGKGLFADILSVLAMTYSDTGKRETLMYRMKGGSDEDPGTWGHEYVRCVYFPQRSQSTMLCVLHKLMACSIKQPSCSRDRGGLRGADRHASIVQIHAL